MRSTTEGFTLVELIVSIGIFVILAAIVIANFRTGARADAIRKAARIAESILQRAQTMTITGAIQNQTACSGAFAGGFPQGGYGVVFNRASSFPREIILFADVDNDKAYTDGCDLPIEVVRAPGNARYSGAAEKVVIFPPLDGLPVYDNGVSAESGTIQIDFEDPAISYTQGVGILGGSGQIYYISN